MDTRDVSPAEPACVFERAYARHRRAIQAYFQGRTGEPELSQELTQETFIRGWKHIHVLQGMEENQHRNWLFSVAKNLLTDYYRKRATREKVDEQLRQHGELYAQVSSTPEQAWDKQEQIQQLDDAIAQLPENLRTVLLLQVVGQLNSTQIGEALELPAGTVRYQISVARKRLAQAMKLIV